MGPVALGYLASTPDMYAPPGGNSWSPSNKELFGHWLKKGLWLNRRGDDAIQYSSELYSDAAVEHLTRVVPQKTNPFFMYVGFNAPHDPRQAPQEYLDMYPVEKIAVPPNFLPEHPFDQGKRVEMVYQHSMYATTCDLAGVNLPKHVEFPSLVPMLRKEKPEPINDAMFGWPNVLQRSIRPQRHKLIFYAPINRYQIFDLEKDPWEMHDLVDDPTCADVKQELIAKLKEKQKQLGDPMDIDHSEQKPRFPNM